MAWDSISKVTLLNYKIVTAGEHFNKSTTYVRSSLYRLIIQWFAFLSLLSYSILMLRPYSIPWAGTLLLYLRTSWNAAEFYSMLSSDELPVLSSDSEPLSAKISAKISSFLSVSIKIACTVRPTVPLDQCTGWKRTRFKLGAWVLLGTRYRY